LRRTLLLLLSSIEFVILGSAVNEVGMDGSGVVEREEEAGGGVNLIAA
jgi:hypothetical protein